MSNAPKLGIPLEGPRLVVFEQSALAATLNRNNDCVSILVSCHTVVRNPVASPCPPESCPERVAARIDSADQDVLSLTKTEVRFSGHVDKTVLVDGKALAACIGYHVVLPCQLERLGSGDPRNHRDCKQ